MQNSTIERLTFRNSGPKNRLQQETERLHIERYTYAAQHVKGKQVLDLACGVGYGSLIMQKAGALKVIGVDLASEALEEAQALHSNANIEYYQADYRDLANPNSIAKPLAQAYEDQFDVVVSLETIEHIPDPVDFIEILLGGLRQGGLFIGSVPVTPSMDANPYHLHDFSPNSFRRMLKQENLEIIDTFRQVQRFNPMTVQNEMHDNGRSDLRTNLMSYYITHPNKAFLRAWSTLRFGFANIIDTVVAQKK